MTTRQDAPPDPGAVKAGRPATALAWGFASTILGRFGTLAIGIVLARLLGPAEFGTFAVALVALLAMLSFNELGVSLAIVRWKAEPTTIAPTVTTLSVLGSMALTVLMVALAPAFASMMGDPGATRHVQLLSLCILINGVVAVPAAVLQRLFHGGRRMLADQMNIWLGAVVSVALALAGIGAMSLVVGRLAGSLVSAAILLSLSPVPFRLGFDRETARALLSFGLPLAGASIVVFLVSFLDQMLVGHLLGAVALGYFVLATNLANWPQSLFSQPLRGVAPAVFARIERGTPEVSLAFRRVLRPLSAAALPICAVISVAADNLVGFVYGDVWLPAGQVLRWLAILVSLRILFELFYDYLVVIGKTTRIMMIQMAWIATLIPLLLYAVTEGGLRGAGPALVVASLPALGLYLWELRRTDVHVRHVAQGMIVPVLASLGVALGTMAIVSGVESRFMSLAASGTLAAFATTACLYWCRKDLTILREARNS